jgi:hypothetical protein
MIDRQAGKKSGDYKLFVVGEKSPNPCEWIRGDARAFVIAASRAEALELVGDLSVSAEAVEVSLESPALLEYALAKINPL